MTLSHFSHPDRDRPSSADHRIETGAGTTAVALTQAILDGAGAAVTALGGRIRDGVDRWRRRRDAIRELAVLDERMLRDIGLRRSDIPFVVERLLDEPPPLRTIAKAGGPGIESRPVAPAPVGCG